MLPVVRVKNSVPAAVTVFNEIQLVVNGLGD